MAAISLYDELENTDGDIPTVPHAHTLPNWVLADHERDIGKRWVEATRERLVLTRPKWLDHTTRTGQVRDA